MGNHKLPGSRAAALLCIVWIAASCGAADATHGRFTVVTAALDPQPWLSVDVSPRFDALAEYDFVADPRFDAEVVPYLEERGVADPDDQIARVRADFHNLAHALTVLFETDPEVVAEMTMPPAFTELFDGDDLQVDHVGRELFGPLPFYLGAMRATAPDLRLEHVPLEAGDYVTRDGDLLFPSTGVVLDLRAVDPSLSGVTVGRIYFRDAGSETSDRCIELFQSARIDGTDPQDDAFTLARIAVLYADLDARLGDRIDFDRVDGFVSQDGAIPPVVPISHVALRADDVETVYEVQRRSERDETGNVRPYVDEVTYNEADRSTNAKIVVRAPGPVPVFNRIVEVVHYGEP
ncbi:MAG: hypothetical protein AAF997_22610 [Myxococcota bacterium]